MFDSFAWIRHHLLVSLLTLFLLLLLIVGGLFAWTRAQGSSVRNGKISSCGSLTLHTGGENAYVLSPNARTIEQCFVQAYQACQEKTLDVTWMGVDTGSKSTFTPQKRGQSCQISQLSQAYGVVIKTSPQTSTCQGLTQNTTTLILKHCGDAGDILLPRSEMCGYVYPQQTPVAVQQAEACFVQDAHQCYGAALGYEPSSSLGYTFQLDFACHLTVMVSTTQSIYSCSGLSQQADGLHALNCGSQGTLLIPAHP